MASAGKEHTSHPKEWEKINRAEEKKEKKKGWGGK